MDPNQRSLRGRVKPLTHSEDAEESDEHHGSLTRLKEGLCHVAAEHQGQVGSHGRSGDGTYVWYSRLPRSLGFKEAQAYNSYL